ncbi:Peptidase family M28 [Posidoniimonas polymericola]|uniref:Peptidase family M28 n=1 Tax=Posidoniimonas polymericola TaxID=2528002 RepID=A0A5C5YTX3_9BACT|nr:M28 family peptidase [Posidoniimonas polymericola]TWT78449.1 Peptidase family M28 [Posidoniimonas polymericola]
MNTLCRPALLAIACATLLAPNSRAEGPNPIDADRAFGYLEQLCELGPRPSGSGAMRQQQDLLRQHFAPLADDVVDQRCTAPNPLGGPKVLITNIIARFNPAAEERLIVCAHYDTRPLPDRDPNPTAARAGRFIGANDGASGTALLMELAHHQEALAGPLGIDLVLFDGEELVYNDRRDPYFLGSTWFAMQYKKGKHPGGKYKYAVLVDMIADADLDLYYEINSWRWKDTRPLVQSLWKTADRLGIDEFHPRTKHQANDDHVPLHKIGKIPACDIIDFDYPHWHTESDVPRNCSSESLAKVGWVVLEWIKAEQAQAAAGD